MQLGYAIIADAAQVLPDGKVNMLGGDFDTIYAPAFPARHNALAFVVKLLFSTLSEVETQHQVRVDLTDPKGGNHTLGSTVVIPEAKSGAPELPARFSMVINLQNLEFQLPGKYSMRLIVDEKELGALPLYLKQGSVNHDRAQKR